MSLSNVTCNLCGTVVDATALGGLCPRCMAMDFFAPASPRKREAGASFLDADERLLGDYELLEEIARGGMGVVYRARQASLGRTVAVKMILHGVLAGDAAITRFKAEASAAAGLNHPNIVAIHEIGEHRGRHFFSMEFVEGRTLADLVRDGPLPAKLAAGYLERVAVAVHYAHERGVLHRDLKPSNVLINRLDQPQVTDFGLAKRFGSESDLTLTGQVLGTPAYISPEQAGGAKFGPLDARSDVYSLGAVLYHAMCGLAPFSGESATEILHKVIGLEPVAPRVLNPALPRDLETICLKCLAKEPARRYTSALELAEDLGRFLRGEPIVARPVGRPEKLWRWARRQPALAASLAGCVVILVGGVSGILWQLRQTQAAQAIAVKKAADEAAQRQLAEQAQKQAEASALTMRQNLYAADMLEVRRAIDQNDLGTARLLLDAHRPKTGETDLRGFEWRYLWKQSQGDDCIVLNTGDKALGAVAFSPDGKWLASVGKETLVYDTVSWQVRGRDSEPYMGTLAFTPDSSSLLLGLWSLGSWIVKRWDWQQNGIPAEFFDPHATWPYVAISPAADVIAVGCGTDPSAHDPEGTTKLFDAITGQPRQILPESGGRTAFSPDGKMLATGSWKNTVKVWNPATGELIRTLTNADHVVDMTFSPDGRTLAICTPSVGETWLYDVATGAQRPFARGDFCCVWGAAFSPDGTTLATACTDETVRLWNLKSGQQTACFLGHHYQVGSVAWSPNGRILASGGSDGTVRLWNVAAAKNAEAPIASVVGEVKARLFSRDGKQVVVTGPDGTVALYEWPSLRAIAGPHHIGQPLGFLPDGKAVVSIWWTSTNDNAEVVWWSVPDFHLLKQTALSQPVARSTVCQLSPDGNRLATGGAEGEVRLFDLAHNGRLFAQASETEDDDGYAATLAFTPDSRLLAIGFARSTPVYFWDMTPSHRLSGVKGHRAPILCFAFSQDGRTLVSGDGDKMVNSWDVSGRKELATFPGEDQKIGVTSLDLSPDGKTLATRTDKGVRLLNMVTRREVARFETTASLSSVAFAPDGSALLMTEQSTNGPVTLIKRAPNFEETDSQP